MKRISHIGFGSLLFLALILLNNAVMVRADSCMPSGVVFYFDVCARVALNTISNLKISWPNSISSGFLATENWTSYQYFQVDETDWDGSEVFDTANVTNIGILEKTGQDGKSRVAS